MAKEKRKHYSVTQIKMANRCGAQYEYRYIQGHKVPPSSAMLFGRVIHQEMLERNLGHKLETGIEMKPSDLEDSFVTEWKAACEDVLWLDVEVSRGIDIVREELKVEGVKLVNKLRNDWTPRIDPEHVEKEFEINFKGMDWYFMGFIDLITKEQRLIDLKTSSKKPSADAVRSDFQLAAYTLGYQAMNDGALPKSLELHTAVRYVKGAQVIEDSAKPNSLSVKRFLNRLQSTVQSIEAGLVVPSDPAHWACSERACGYWKICQYRP